MCLGLHVPERHSLRYARQHPDGQPPVELCASNEGDLVTRGSRSRGERHQWKDMAVGRDG